MMNKKIDAVILGAAIGDVLVRPMPETLNPQGSTPVESIRVSLGGDALNEATVMARLGHAPMLATLLGEDDMAATVRSHCAREGILLRAAVRPDMDTGVNVVLVGEDGERRFLTNPNGTLRRLGLSEILPQLESEEYASARLVCLASLFVSPALPLDDTERLFAKIRADGKILCADTTKRKNGETLKDAAPVLRHLNYFFPNMEEAGLLTGTTDPDETADALLGAGVETVALKLGGRGCLVKSAKERHLVPAVPGIRPVDTTGAGDTFAAAFQCGILEGESLVRCAALANAAASMCVEKLGATAASLDRTEIHRRRDGILSRMD